MMNSQDQNTTNFKILYFPKRMLLLILKHSLVAHELCVLNTLKLLDE